MKKFISILSALAISASMLPMSAMAEVAPETVMYENDFNAATIQEALKTYENEYLSFPGFTLKADGEYEDNIEGDNPSLAGGGVADGVENGINGRTLLFDFTKGGTKAGISEGILKISYDLALRGGDVNDSYAQSYTGINMANYWDGGRMVYFDATGWDTEETINGWPGEPSQFIDTAMHKYEYLFNFAAQKAFMYIDGELAYTWNNLNGSYGTVNNYSIALNGDIKVLDNIKISTLNQDATYSFTADAEVANGYVDVVFPATMDVTKGAFTVDGIPADSVDWSDLNTARVYSEALYEGGTHTVTVAEAQDLYGVAPQNNEVSVATEVLLPEEVLYYNTFDNGATGGPSALNMETDDFKLTAASNGGWNTVSYEGNTGVATNTGAYPSGRNLVFDFTKDGTQAAVTSGVYKAEFDFSAGAGGGDVLWWGMNLTNHYEGGRMVRIYIVDGVRTLNALNQIGQWNGGETISLDNSKKYHFEMYLDVTGGTATTYVDGEYFNSTVIGKSMSNITINLNGYVDYFDNLKVSKMNVGTDYTYKAKVLGTVADGFVDVEFPAWMDTASGEFTVDSEVADSIDWLSTSTVRVYSDKLTKVGAHTISMTNVVDMYGVAPRISSYNFNLVKWDNEYILYESTFDNGNSDLYWTEENPAFTGGYNATKPEDATKPIGGVRPENARFGGNMGIGYHSEAWPTGTTLWFDFTKGGTLSAPTSGKMKFSFDFIMQKTTDPEGSSFIKNTANNAATSSWSGGGFIYKNEKPYLITWDGSGSNYIRYTDVDKFGTELDYEIHTLDIVIQHGGQAYLHYYLDGVKMPKVFNYWTSANSFGFAMSGVLKYVDNVKLSYIKDGSFGVESLKAPKAGDETLTLYTTEQADALTTNDVLVTVNGETVTPSNVLVKTNPGSMNNDTRYAVEITLPEAAAEGDEYTVTLADTAKSVMGYKVNVKYNNAQAQALAVEDVQTSLVIEDGVAKAVVANKEDKAINPVMIIARYDEEGRFEGMTAYKGYTIDGFGVKEIPAGEVAELQYNVGNLSGDVKVMLVSDYKTMSPMTPSVEN